VTVKPAEEWGTPFRRPTDAPVAADDAQLAHLAAGSDRGSGCEFVIGVNAGDVLKTLGVPPGRTAGEQFRYPFDLAWAILDDSDPVPFVAHLLAHRRGWGGEFAVVMNVGWWGSWYLGPKAHPNDGLLDVTAGRLSWQQRYLARQRVGRGTHLPHPALRTLRRDRWRHDLGRPTAVFLDGRFQGRARHLEVSVEPDRFSLVV